MSLHECQTYTLQYSVSFHISNACIKMISKVLLCVDFILIFLNQVCHPLDKYQFLARTLCDTWWYQAHKCSILNSTIYQTYQIWHEIMYQIARTINFFWRHVEFHMKDHNHSRQAHGCAFNYIHIEIVIQYCMCTIHGTFPCDGTIHIGILGTICFNV